MIGKTIGMILSSDVLCHRQHRPTARLFQRTPYDRLLSHSWFLVCNPEVGLVNDVHYSSHLQESLANTKVSAQQPWYIGRNALNRLRLRSPSNINLIYTSLKSTFSAQQFPRWQCGSIFIGLAVVAFQTCQLAQNSEKIWTYSSSRSSKLDDFGTNRKRICDFLLVINSNFGPILHRFWVSEIRRLIG